MPAYPNVCEFNFFVNINQSSTLCILVSCEGDHCKIHVCPVLGIRMAILETLFYDSLECSQCYEASLGICLGRIHWGPLIEKQLFDRFCSNFAHFKIKLRLRIQYFTREIMHCFAGTNFCV